MHSSLCMCIYTDDCLWQNRKGRTNDNRKHGNKPIRSWDRIVSDYGKLYCKDQKNGTNAQIEVFKGLSHGFGLGQGTVAEGWIDHAVAFWEENMGDRK